MSVLLDAGAFIAIERDHELVLTIVKTEYRARRRAITHGGIVGQVWRGTGRQARIATALAMCEVVPLDDELGRRAGILLGRARKTDVVDAGLVMLAADGDIIITSAPGDLEALASALGVHVDLIEV